jgi:hypothetical protein
MGTDAPLLPPFLPTLDKWVHFVDSSKTGSSVCKGLQGVEWGELSTKW